MLESLGYFGVILIAVAVFGVFIIIIRMYRKAIQGEAMVKTGLGGTKVYFSGAFVVPIIHKLEVMDITLKTIVISRTGSEGLICKDNMRADIKVTFFVRVNQTREDVKQVAQSIGCKRASDSEMLVNLFDAKFSEALKTVGKQFDFVELYNSRESFKQEILNIIGTDLNGYILDDAAIDFLEQTPLESLDEKNILDSEGIKKIIELTAKQKILSNQIEREKEKTITKQDVEAKETVLQLEKQQAEAEEKQRREVASIRAREQAEVDRVREEERLKAEKARINTEEEIQVAEESRLRQVAVAAKNKEKTEAVEAERVEQARSLEATERERVVALAQIEKEKALEEERKKIQDVIAERVAVEKSVVEQEEKIKDTKAHAEAERLKAVAILEAEKDAEAELVKTIKSAEAERQAAEQEAKKLLIDAEAEQASADHRAQAKKTLAEAEAAEFAAKGLSEAKVMEAKASAREKEGSAEASVIESKVEAEAKGIELKGEAQAEANAKIGETEAKVLEQKGLAEARIIETKASAEEKRGLAEATVMREKLKADADGVELKAQAMQKLDGVGKEHEEFKLRLQKEKDIELAQINIAKDIAAAQASVLAEALKAAKIEIVGGESMFFEQIMGAITQGRKIDRTLNNSQVLTEVKDTFFNTEGGQQFKDKLRGFIDQFGLTSNDVKNLSISALLAKLMKETDQDDTRSMLKQLGKVAESLGIANKSVKGAGLLK